MKIKLIELGNSKDKTDTTFLYDKAHCKSIILKYSFKELEQLVTKEVNNDKVS